MDDLRNIMAELDEQELEEAQIKWWSHVKGSWTRIGIAFLVDIFWEPNDPFKVVVHSYVNPSFGVYAGNHWRRVKLPLQIQALNFYGPLNNVAQKISAFLQGSTQQVLLSLKQEKQHKKKTDQSTKKKTGPKGPWKFTNDDDEDPSSPGSQWAAGEIAGDLLGNQREAFESWELLRASLDEASILSQLGEARPGIRFMIDIFFKPGSAQIIDYQAQIQFTIGVKQGWRYKRFAIPMILPSIMLNGKLDPIVHKIAGFVQLKTGEQIKKEVEGEKAAEAKAKADKKRRNQSASATQIPVDKKRDMMRKARDKSELEKRLKKVPPKK